MGLHNSQIHQTHSSPSNPNAVSLTFDALKGCFTESCISESYICVCEYVTINDSICANDMSKPKLCKTRPNEKYSPLTGMNKSDCTVNNMINTMLVFTLILSVFLTHEMNIDRPPFREVIEDNCENGVILAESEASVRGNVESSHAILQQLKIQNSSRIILGHIIINSFRNKLEMLSFIVSGKMDILIISESKLDDSFPSAQLHINGFSLPYRYDRNRFGGGVLMYIREDIPSKESKSSYSSGNIESIFVEINLHKKIIGGTYSP